MIKGTRFFSRRLLPLLLAAVMLLGMLPALTLPVLAEEPPASQKLTNTTDTVVTYQGAVGTGRNPSLVVDGDTSHNDNKYFVVGNDQPQVKNEENPVNPTYWIQLDLGKKYSLTEMKLFVYHGRALKNLVVLASDSSTFDTYSIIWNADKENFFGLGAGDKEQFPNATVAGDTITLAAPTEAQYVRILNNGHTAGTGQGAHYFEIEVYGTEHTGGGTPPVATLRNAAANRPATVNKDGSVDPNRNPSLLTDGNKEKANYTEISRDKKQDTNDPSYAQIDLGNVYAVSEVRFWNHWDGRELKSLHILLSENADFQSSTEIYNSNWTPSAEGLTVQTPNGTPINARYVRVWNDGYVNGNHGGHYVEIEVMTTEDDKGEQPAEYNDRDVLTIPTYEYQGKAPNNVTHPDVLDFTLVNGVGGTPLGTWGGHRFWMAVTPNQEGNSQFENPCLVWSDDGKIWSAEGIPNPLSVVEREPDGTHNCDNDVIYDPVSDELWVYYVWEQDAQNYGQIGTSNFRPSILRRIRVAATQGGNGFTYAVQKDAGEENPYTDLVTSTYHYDMQSPAVVRRDANTWLMWSNNSDQGVAPTGWNNQNGFVELRRSNNGKDWDAPQSLQTTFVLKGETKDYIPWHLDVQWIPNVGADESGEYWALICAYPKGGGSNYTELFFAKSVDGELWTTYPNPILSPRSGQWDQNFIYRSSFTYDADGKLSVWYSGGKEQPGNHWRIAYTEFENFLKNTLPTLGEPYTPDMPTPPQPGEWIDVNPGSGDIRFDDVWAQGSEGWKNEGNTDASCYKQGSKATLCFYGTAVQWIGQQESCFGQAVVTLDGVQVNADKVKSQYVESGNPQDVVLYSVEGLPEAAHVLTIEPESEGQRHTVGSVQPHGGVQITKLQYKGPAKGAAETGAYSITPDTITVGVGQTAQIDVLLPFNAKNTTATYVSNNTVTADVSNTGLVTGAAAGETTITVTPGVGAAGNKTVNVTVTAGGQTETWVRVQETDGNITYSEGWTTVSEGGMDGGSAKQTSTTGATAEFKFTGTGFRWIGQRETNYGEALVYVDGVPFAYVSANGAAVYQFMLFQINGLTNEEHTVKIEAQTLRAGGSGNDPGIWLELDALEYYTGTKPLNTEVTSVALRPSENITMDVGAEISVLATAMNTDQVAVHGKALQYSVADADTADLTGGENGLRKLTGKKAGATKLTASLTDNNTIKAERTVTVLSDGMQETPRMPVDEKHPLLLVSIYAQTKKQDWWGSGVPKGVPAQGNLSVTGVWEMIPDDLKPYTAIQLHGDDFIGHGYGGYGDHDALWAWYSYFVDQAEAYNATQQDKSKHINLYLTLMTGGTPISYLDRTIPDAELLQFLDDHECIKGVVLSENHNNGNTVGVAQVTAKYLKLMAQKGCYLVLTDIDKPNANMMEKWFNDTDELYNAAKKYHKYLIINSKSTSGSGFNTVRSFALGTWLAGLADNWGALTDAWAWYESGFAQLFKPNTRPNYEDVRRVYTFPETLFAMTMLQCYANGAVVFNAEHPFYCTGVNDKASWVLKESILPAFRYIVQHPAADRDTVAAQIQAGIFTNGQYLPANYVDGLYGNQWDSNFLQTTGRYRVLPIFTKYVQDADVPAHILNNKLRVSDFTSSAAATRERLKGLYPEHYTGTAYAVELYGSESRWLVMNSSFNENNSQDALIEPKTATFATQMELTLTPHTYLVTSETDSAITIDLNNFRADKDELWVSGKSLNSTDWATVSPDGSWNGDVHRHVTEYMAYHIDNPQLDKQDNERRDLRDTVIKLTVNEQPTATVRRVGQGSRSLADNSFYTEAYENGIYTLTITHNGQVNVTIRKGGAQPIPTVTSYNVTPTELSSDGGEITVTLTGTDLTDGIQIKAGTITAQTTGGATNQTETLTLPANTGAQPMTYTVQYSLDGHDWMGSKTVIVKAPTGTPPAPAPSGGGSSASVGRPSVREDAGQSQAAAERTRFIDVLRDSWYYSSVYRAHENGLIDGVGGRRFDPDATLTVAQAIKLSAALHQLDRTGEVSLKNGAGSWYDAYVSYAIANGILEERYAGYSREQMNAPVTRGEFVHILHGALEHYEQLNTVADNALPDVKLGDAFAAAIYELYRAGILHGNDTAGTFRPESTIKRSEAAAILNRMYDKTARKTVSLP